MAYGLFGAKPLSQPIMRYCQLYQWGRISVKIPHVISVTEDEIHNGILTVDNVDTACYWFKRTLEGLTENTGDKTARRYMDIAKGEPDEDAVKLLNKLKYSAVPL